MVSDTYGPGRVLKASDVRLRRDDPNAAPVADRIALAERNAFRAGYEEGFTAGAVQAGAELAAAVDRLRADVVQAIAAHAASVQATREADALHLVEHAIAIAEWAARRELTSVPDAFFARLAELLADRERGEAIDIATSPALVEKTKRWLHADGGFGPDDAVRVVAAEGLADGEARVTVGDSTIFATFADTFERARAALGLGPDGPSYVELLGPAALAADPSPVPAITTHDPAMALAPAATHHPARPSGVLDAADAADAEDVEEEMVEVLYDMTLPAVGPAPAARPNGTSAMLDGTVEGPR